MKKLIVLSLLLLTINSYSQNIRQVADSIRIWRRVPALAYAVVSADSVYHMGAVGYKRLRTKDTVSLYNRFHLGTATASITSFIAAELVKQGEIKWNTPLMQLFPEAK